MTWNNIDLSNLKNENLIFFKLLHIYMIRNQELLGE